MQPGSKPNLQKSQEGLYGKYFKQSANICIYNSNTLGPERLIIDCLKMPEAYDTTVYR